MPKDKERNTNNYSGRPKRQRRLIDYAQFARNGAAPDPVGQAIDSDDEPSTSDGRRHSRRQKSPDIPVPELSSDDESTPTLDSNRHTRTYSQSHGSQTGPQRTDSWYTLDGVNHRHHDATNTDITSFRVRASPDVASIKTLQDYQILIYDMMADLINQIAHHAAADDMVKIMLMSDSLETPIIAPPVPFSQLTPDSILECIENVFQSNKIFIHDDGFIFYAAVTHRPHGMGLPHKQFTAAQAVKNLHSIVNVRTTGGLCLPACLLLAQASANGDTQTYNMWRNTARPQLRRAADAYAQAVLGRDIDPVQGCTFDDLDVFQETIADEFEISVYRWGPPSRKCIYKGQCQSATPKRIFLMYHNHHFDLIKSLPSFFQVANYCHKCDKPYADERRHKCIVKCSGCFRQNCADRDGNMNIFCPDCSRFFPGNRCFMEHLMAKEGGRSFCSRVKYCFTCSKLRCEWGRKENKHVCGGIFCQNCDSYEDRDHKCFMKKFKLKTTSYTSQTGDGASVSGDSDDDSGDIAENLARDAELEDGVIAGPDVQDEMAFLNHKICYFDSEAFVCDNDGIHIPNLIVSQTDDDHEWTFDGLDATDQFCNWAIAPIHKNWTFVSHYGRNGCFLSAPLAKLPSMFGIQDIRKGNFPHKFNKPENFDYEGPMPPVHTYDPDRMSTSNRQKFLDWYNDQVQNNYVFNFHTELLEYCRDDVKILRICSEKFRHLFYTQSTVDPFSCLTIASACNKVFRKLFLPANTIAIIPPNGYLGNDIQSHAALEWLGYMSYSTGLRIRHRNNGGEVQVTVPNGRIFKLDGACQDNGRKLAFKFYGCWYHGCPKCYTATTFNPLLKLTMLELYNATRSREAMLKHSGWYVDSIWHCEYLAQKIESTDLRSYIDRFGVPTPISPRDAFMGGRVNATQLYCEAPPGMAIRYYDINSLYPYCNKYKSYPVGHPTILRGPEIDVNHIDQYCGLFKGRVLPPRNLYHPLLGHRANKKLLFPLCQTCADTQDQGPCTHTQEERALSGTWTTIELMKAIELGYIILDCYEVWHFEEQSDTLFKGMMNMYLKSKQEARGWPNGCNTDDEKQAYVDEYFDLEGVHLDIDKIESNAGRYANSKICLNSVWGKFGEREGLANTIYMDNEVDFWKMLKNEQYRILDYSFPTNHYVTYEDRKEFLTPNLHTNVIIAAFTTAFARLELYKSLENLQNNVLYFDTDSVFFLDVDPQNPDIWRPPIGEQLGVYKDECGGHDYIVQAAFAGPKNYQYTTRDGKTCMKVRGFTLNHQASQQLTHAAMRTMVINQDRQTVIDVNMGMNIRKNKATWTLSNYDNIKQYRFKYDKRILLPNSTTVPYGYVGPLPQPVGIVPP